mmetsp:Transcript_41556/g.87018  ORF Transcript_41556/g.87018 Transcript_41556/m.87018 type:complete len:95 (+) Transcript_41556:481-765(+)
MSSALAPLGGAAASSTLPGSEVATVAGDAVEGASSSGGTANDNPSGIRPVLQNIVATCNLAAELDLKTIAMHARNAEYNPKRFSAVIMRIREPD